MAKILKGAPVAKYLTESIAIHVQALRVQDIIPKIAILRVGDREDDVAYERAAIKRMDSVGVEVCSIVLPKDSSKEEVLGAVDRINKDDSIHGCIMFRPLEDKDIEDACCKMLDPKKDIDGMSPVSMSSVFMGFGVGYAPCTAGACVEMLKYYGYDFEGKKVVVIGRSLVIGRPVAMMMMAKNATVTMCHSKTKDIAKICKEADIIIAAVGKAGFVTKDFVNENTVVLDVGINVDDDGNIKGDVLYEEVEPIVEAITPVPAGIGSLTTSILASHVVTACERKKNEVDV